MKSRAARYASLFAAAALAVAPHQLLAQRAGLAGDVAGTAPIAGTAQLVATVEAVDAAARTMTLRGAKGAQTLGVSTDVRNFRQVKVGDRVVVTYAQALALELKKSVAGIRDHVEREFAARAASGGKAPGMIAREIAVIADVVAVNYMKQTLTLRGPTQTVTLLVPDAVLLRAITTGDQVQAIYAEPFAVAVKAAPRGPGGE